MIGIDSAISALLPDMSEHCLLHLKSYRHFILYAFHCYSCAMAGLKRCPGVESVMLAEDGLERSSKRHSFEVETSECRATDCLQDLFDWPERTLADLKSTSLAGHGRLKYLLMDRGFDLHTFYSGQDCAGQALQFIIRTIALGDEVSRNKIEEWKGQVRVWSASDIDPTCQRVLQEFSFGKAEHIFGDICQRVPPFLFEKLQEIKQRIDQKFSERLSTSGINRVWHQEKKDDIGPCLEGSGIAWEMETVEDSVPAPCSEFKKKVVQELSDQLFEETSQVLAERLTSQKDAQSHGPCGVHCSDCPYHPVKVEGRLSVWIAGTTCTDECPTGSKRQLTGKAAIPFMVFLSEVRVHEPDAVLHECTHLFNESNLHKGLGHIYHLVSCRMSPIEYGVPFTRPRLITWCLHKKHLIKENIFADECLKSHFQIGTVLEGDVFFSAPKSWVERYMQQAAQKAGVSLAECSAGMEPCLSGGDLGRIRTQEMEELARRGEDPDDQRIWLTDGICMKTQTAGFSRVKTLMPSLMTKSVPWSYRYKRDLIPLEALHVMGVPVFQEHIPRKYTGIYSCPFRRLLPLLKDGEVRKLAGNGMSLQVIGVALVAGLSSFEFCSSPPAKLVAEGGEGNE